MRQTQHSGRIRAYADNVLVLMHDIRDARTERRTDGGIVIPAADPKDDGAVVATVVSAGPGAVDTPILHDEGMRGYRAPKVSRRYVPMDPAVTAGATVLVDSRQAGEPVYVDGLEHRMVRAEQIVGVVEP